MHGAIGAGALILCQRWIVRGCGCDLVGKEECLGDGFHVCSVVHDHSNSPGSGRRAQDVNNHMSGEAKCNQFRIDNDRHYCGVCCHPRFISHVLQSMLPGALRRGYLDTTTPTPAGRLPMSLIRGAKIGKACDRFGAVTTRLDIPQTHMLNSSRNKYGGNDGFYAFVRHSGGCSLALGLRHWRGADGPGQLHGFGDQHGLRLRLRGRQQGRGVSGGEPVLFRQRHAGVHGFAHGKGWDHRCPVRRG